MAKLYLQFNDLEVKVHMRLPKFRPSFKVGLVEDKEHASEIVWKAKTNPKDIPNIPGVKILSKNV